MARLAAIAAAALAAAVAVAASLPDVDGILANRPAIDVVDIAVLGSLNTLLKMVSESLQSATSSADRLSALSSLVKIKDAQVEDAATLQRLVSAQVAKTEESVRGLREMAAERRKGSAMLSEKLLKQVSEEDALQGKIETEKKDIAALEKSLDKIRKEADAPRLARWVERRFQSVGNVLDDSSSAEELGKAAYDVVHGMGRTVDYLESTAFVNPLVAFFLSGLLFVLPMAAVVAAASRLSRKISHRQHLLIGHIFNLVFALSCCIVSIFGGYDPLVELHLTAPVRWFMLVAFFIVQWPVLLCALVYSGLRGKSSTERRNFGYQTVLFLSVCYHIVKNTYVVAASKSSSGLPGNVNVKSYVLYVLSFVSLVLMTVLSAESNESGLIGDVRGYIFEGDARRSFTSRKSGSISLTSRVVEPLNEDKTS